MIKLPPRYAKIQKVFSSGGMADTLLCFDEHLQRSVVVKSLKQDVDYSKLVDELAALSSIRSRYVVEVLDVIVDDGKPVGIVEEYLPGAELAPLAQGVACSDALRALYPVAAGIADVHAHHRIHRDIKPDNMRYDAEGQLKIFDFGLAKINSSPGTKVLYFTAGYTAPECFAQNAHGMHTYDYPVDVYAFGCVAAWMLNNGTLFPEMMGVPPSLPAGFQFGNHPVGLDAQTSALLLRCLDPNPAARPSIAACRDHLGRELLRDQHTMNLTSNGQQYILNKKSRSARIASGSNSIEVKYDGVDFIISALSGSVAINNVAAIVGQRLSGSTVIVLGQSGGRRISVACDVSHPEVTL